MKTNTQQLLICLAADETAQFPSIPQQCDELDRLYETAGEIVNVLKKHTVITEDLSFFYVFDDDAELDGQCNRYNGIGAAIGVAKSACRADIDYLRTVIIHEMTHLSVLWHDAEFHALYKDLLHYWNTETGDHLADIDMLTQIRWDSARM